MKFQDQLTAGVEHLRQHDPILAQVIDRSPRCDLRPHSDYFRALAGSVIGQQLSVKAAATIRGRFAALGSRNFPTPHEVIALDDQVLRAAGLSGAKARYVKDLAQHVVDGRLEIDRIPHLTNDEIIVELTDIKGIGEWTAHMFLIFCLGRLDVLPTGDLGVRKGMQVLYELPDLPTPEQMMTVAERKGWAGYESVAAWYVWEALDNAPK